MNDDNDHRDGLPTADNPAPIPGDPPGVRGEEAERDKAVEMGQDNRDRPQHLADNDGQSVLSGGRKGRREMAEDRSNPLPDHEDEQREQLYVRTPEGFVPEDNRGAPPIRVSPVVASQPLGALASAPPAHTMEQESAVAVLRNKWSEFREWAAGFKHQLDTGRDAHLAEAVRLATSHATQIDRVNSAAGGPGSVPAADPAA